MGGVNTEKRQEGREERERQEQRENGPKLFCSDLRPKQRKAYKSVILRSITKRM